MTVKAVAIDAFEPWPRGGGHSYTPCMALNLTTDAECDEEIIRRLVEVVRGDVALIDGRDGLPVIRAELATRVR